MSRAPGGPLLRACSVAAVALLLAACGSEPPQQDSGQSTGALGGSDETVLLAETTTSLPGGPLAWTAYAVSEVEHAHAPAFVHARADTALAVGGDRKELKPGEAVFVPGGTEHTHGKGEAWDVLLAAPDAAPPPDVTSPAVFTSGPLQGLPGGSARVSALRVTLPPGAQTSVHTHPGPEFIYGTRGSFDYQNALVATVRSGEGDGHALPADTAVQKRNPEGPPAEFLSWFIVDPAKPFAPPASFG